MTEKERKELVDLFKNNFYVSEVTFYRFSIEKLNELSSKLDTNSSLKTKYFDIDNFKKILVNYFSKIYNGKKIFLKFNLFFFNNIIYKQK
jgi:hypothetical protein